MQNATPRPWKKHETEGKIYASIRGANNEMVADCGSRSDVTAQANSALIVQAVNSHDALIEACKEAFTVIGEGMIDNCLTEEELPVWEALMTKLENALKLAKGE